MFSMDDHNPTGDFYDLPEREEIWQLLTPWQEVPVPLAEIGRSV
jgi:hypothetical protein